MLTKTLLITGVSTGGIGFETCKRIFEIQKVARQPVSWHIFLAQRDPNSQEALEAFRKLESMAHLVDGRVTAKKCNLADYSSIREFAHYVQQSTRTLDVLILNAGVWLNSCQDTMDGNNMCYQINHLGQFLLTSLLTQGVHIRERVIFVGSSLHKKASSDSTLRSIDGDASEYGTGMKQYAQSKLLTAYCMHYWQEELKASGVSVFFASPGFVPTSKLNRESAKSLRIAMAWVFWLFPFVRSLEQAGNTLAAVAISDELNIASGSYVSATLVEERMHEDAYDVEHSKKVLDWTMRNCGLLE